MKKQAIYCRTTSGRRRGIRSTPEEFEALRKRYIRVFSNTTTGVIIIETANNNIDSEIEQFKRMLKSVKKYGIETLLITDLKRISEKNDEVYLMCKLAEDNGIEICFINDNLGSKDIIKEYEENNMTGLEMNL